MAIVANSILKKKNYGVLFLFPFFKIYNRLFLILARYFCFISIFLFGCQNKPKSPWIKGPQTKWHRERECEQWSHSPKNKFRELQIEYIYSPSTLRMTLNTFSAPFPYPEVLVLLTFGKTLLPETPESQIRFYAKRLEGGQKLLVPNDVAAEIFRLIKEKKSFYLKAWRYETQIEQ